jgi:hypothetical protein
MSTYKVLALDIEGTLLSNAVSQFPRTGLFDFLTDCQRLFPRIVIFTAISEVRFRSIAHTLVAEGAVPGWFEALEFIHWRGETKDLSFIPGCSLEDAYLVDDLEQYVHPGQHQQWIQIEPFRPSFVGADTGLERVLSELRMKLSQPANFRSS